ncbi:MAG: putative 2-aminoethylphosphonate ABC transporter permease subunit, partial [Pseudodesulfovibrio sp.]
MAQATRAALPAADTFDRELWLKRALILLVSAWLVAVVILPLAQLLSKSLFDNQGVFVGLANYVEYFTTPALRQSIGNSLFVSVTTTLISVT